MRYLVTGGQMKQVDRYTIENIGIPSLVLMERAALAVTGEVMKHGQKTDRIWILCGNGNNGADGVAAARMLHLKGYKVFALLAAGKDKGSSEYLTQVSIAERTGVNLAGFSDLIPGTCDVLIDALFGVGLDREILADTGRSWRQSSAAGRNLRWPWIFLRAFIRIRARSWGLL